MQKSQESIPIERIIKGCTDRTSPDWEWAWRYLFSHYKNYLYKIILNACNMYRVSRLSEKEHICQDIFAQVCLTLCKDDGHVLQSFRAIHSEKAFRYFLAVITKRVARGILIKQKTDRLSDEQLQALENEQADDRIPWESHEWIVEQIRKVHKKNDKNLERNILLYTLYNFEGFTSEMIEKHPLFKGIGYRVVDNVVHRIKTKLAGRKVFRE